jgi:hypothetical protein
LRDCSIGTNARQDRNCTRHGGDDPISGHFPDDRISCVRDIKVAGRIHGQASWTIKHRTGGGPSITSVAIRIRIAEWVVRFTSTCAITGASNGRDHPLRIHLSDSIIIGVRNVDNITHAINRYPEGVLEVGVYRLTTIAGKSGAIST